VSRVASITTGLNEGLKHDLDLRELERRVLALFKWYFRNSEMQTYTAPYLPIVQSSGTGKTRLLIALRAALQSNVDYDCMTVLCLPDDAKDVEDRVV
jgi:predicted ATP-binding protein involved in virulence